MYLQIRNDYKERYFEKLSARVELIFNKRQYFKQYHFNGKPADIFEIAIIMHPYILPFGNKKTTLEQFAKDFALFLGQAVTRIGDQKQTLITRKAHNILFATKGVKRLLKYIDPSEVIDS